MNRIGQRVLLVSVISAAVAASGAWAQARAAAAADLQPSAAGGPVQGDYKIGPLDVLNITVFQVKDLTLDKVQVDATGRILLPLIGGVVAQGKTTAELSAEIADRLKEKYMQNPQVSVLVQEAVSQKVTVEGGVTEAGVFTLKGPTTLLQAVALAKGIDRDGNPHKVTIFREVAGRRIASNYDLKQIMAGKKPDPQIQGSDVVIVATSPWKAALRESIPALPALAYVHW